MKRIIFSIFLLLFISCNGDEDRLGSHIIYKFANNSKCKIKVVLFVKYYYLKDSIVNLNINEKKDICEGGDGNYPISETFFSIIIKDSAYVYYDDTLMVKHRKINSQTKRSIFNDNLYKIAELSKRVYESTFEFTEADYQEALKLYDSIHKKDK